MSDPTVKRVVGECDTCGQQEVADDRDGFDMIVEDLSEHIDDGTSCYDFTVIEEYEDGTEKRIL